MPFNDIVGDASPEPLPEQYQSIISTFPSYPKLGLRCYQGTWLGQHTLPGIIFIQRSFTPSRGDVIIASQPKCGITMARGVYSPGDDAHHPLVRLNPHDCVPFMEGLITGGWGSKIDALPSPRLMSTHMQCSALPSSIINNPGQKIIYICREPKDMLVSAWHFFKTVTPNLSFSEMFESAYEWQMLQRRNWDHIIGYWNASKACPEMVLFLVYEDMLRDPASNVRKLAQFLGQPFSNAEEEAGVVMDIVRLSSFEKLKNAEVNKTGTSMSVFPNTSYFRKGKVGDWADHMTPEMARRFDAIVQDKVCGSGLVFA